MVRRIILYTVFLLICVFCILFFKPRHHEERLLENTFLQWEEGLEAELLSGKSYVFGPETELKYLAEHVASDPEFFLRKLKKNMFVVCILERSELKKEHENQFTGTLGLQSEQRVWLAILEEKIANQP